MFTSFHKRKLLHHHKHHRKSAATTVIIAIEIRLSDTTIGITIIETKTKAALEVANEHLSATTTLVVIHSFYLCVATREMNL